MASSSSSTSMVRKVSSGATSSSSSAASANIKGKIVTSDVASSNNAKSSEQFNRVLDALKQLTQLIESDPSGGEGTKKVFISSYKDMFADIYVKLFIHARDRDELDPIQDELERLWETVFANKNFPKVPQKVKKLVIYPGTSFEDVVQLLAKNETVLDNLLIALKHLKATVKEMTPKKIKSSKVVEALNRLMKLHPQGGVVKQICEQLVQEFTRIDTEAQAEEAVKRAKDERQLELLRKIKEPSAAEKRAITELSGKLAATAKTNGATNGTPSTTARNKSSSSIGPSKSSPSKDGKHSSSANGEEKTKRIKRPMTDEEYMRQFLKRARKTNIEREYEEEVSRRIGEMEDAQAADADDM